MKKQSQIGARSTLLNAGATTNFKYYVKGFDIHQDTVDRINAISTRSKLMDRVNAIYAADCRLDFDKVMCDTFDYNLQMLDGTLAQVMASALVMANRFGLRDFSDLCDLLVDDNPLDLTVPKTKDADEKKILYDLYAYKLKHLLTTIALGMTPGTLWDGIYDANGGYLVVKADGEVLCYHFYDRNRFQDFLFTNSSLDNPSMSRYDYGSLYYDDCGLLSFNLNLQIRLK
jgi:type II restriction enzyme